jgi:hypothetical protein
MRRTDAEFSHRPHPICAYGMLYCHLTVMSVVIRSHGHRIDFCESTAFLPIVLQMQRTLRGMITEFRPPTPRFVASRSTCLPLSPQASTSFIAMSNPSSSSSSSSSSSAEVRSKSCRTRTAGGDLDLGKRKKERSPLSLVSSDGAAAMLGKLLVYLSWT